MESWFPGWRWYRRETQLKRIRGEKGGEKEEEEERRKWRREKGRGGGRGEKGRRRKREGEGADDDNMVIMMMQLPRSRIITRWQHRSAAGSDQTKDAKN